MDWKFVRKILGYCPQCKRWFVYPKRRRMDTAYVDEESNYCYVCAACYVSIQEYWDEQWRNYYSGLL